MHFADDLITAIESKNSRVCVGIDPNGAKFPAEVRPRSDEPRDVIDAFYSFTLGVLDAVAEHAACVKFQSAYFERYHGEGVEAYFSLISEAKNKGLVVIGDVKRGDIGATSEAYAAGHLDPMPGDDVATPHAITVNPMLGPDTLEPFCESADRNGKGLFVLVRTSNPGSATLQDVELGDGRTWSELVADEVNVLAKGRVGGRGWSSVGAVVGATQPHTMERLRTRLPTSIFLLPGYGALGGTAETARAAFDANGLGGLVSASRSVTYPTVEAGQSWQSAVATAAADLREAVNASLGG